VNCSPQVPVALEAIHGKAVIRLVSLCRENFLF